MMKDALRRPLGRIRKFFSHTTNRLQQERNARALSRVFAAFMVDDHRLESAELELAYDYIRNLFPTVDHQTLGQELEAAIREPAALPAPLALLQGVLQVDERKILLIELISLMWHGTPERSAGKLYLRVARGLNLGVFAETVLAELRGEEMQQNLTLPFVDFGGAEANSVALPLPDQAHFRCYGINGVLLIRNLHHQPLTVRGMNLSQDRVIQIRPTDELNLHRWRLSYEDLLFFFQTGSGEQADERFLSFEKSEALLERTRNRDSVARLRFGTSVEVTALKPGLLHRANGDRCPLKTPVSLPYHERITVGEEPELLLDSLRRAGIETGQRFQLPAGRRKVLVSNDPSQLRRGESLLLTPGLSSRFVLEIDFDPSTGRGELKVLDSSQIITVDDQPFLQGPVQDGSLVRLGPSQALRCRFSDNILDEERNLVRDLKIDGLNFSFWKQGRGGRAVDDLHFEVARGQMLCIMGPSGSGKSTLLEIIAGQRRPQSGQVLLNGLSLYERRSRLVPLISFMPQEDALVPNLSVREHLRHACAIRRPHLSRSAISRRINFLTGELGLDHVARRRVGSADSKNLSGGERSRLNAGLDLIGGGEVFLFDEPISGLSSKDSENVMDSLKGLARDKIVIASLHRPSQKILQAFDLVLLLDRGGRMAYFGSPGLLLTYFEAAQRDLDIPLSEAKGADFVFDILETPLPAPAAPLGKRPTRRFPPEFWQERFENRKVMAQLSVSRTPTSRPSTMVDTPKAQDQLPAPEPPAQGKRQRFMIFRTYLARAFFSKFRVPATLYSIGLEAPLLAALVALTLHASADGSYEFPSALHLPSFLFLAVTVAMFFGLTNSATEVSRDRPTLRRERNTRPHPFLYMGSKFTVLAFLITLQSMGFVFVAQSILEIHGMFWRHVGWMTLTGCCGASIALLVSTIARSERTALGAIPLILVPQILLAGALVSFGEMNRGLFINGDRARDAGAEPVPSLLMPLRYAYEGIVVDQATHNPFEMERRALQVQIDEFKEEGNLSSAESQDLQALKQALTRLYVLDARNLPEAYDLLEGKVSSSIEDEDEDLSSRLALTDFFVNERLDNLVTLAESQRLDSRRNTEMPIFLAEKKAFQSGLELPTTTYCISVLTAMTLLFLILASLWLRLSLTRTW